MEIMFNKEGTPLMMYSAYMWADTYTDAKASEERRRALFPYADDRHDYVWFNNERVVGWGVENDWPDKAIGIIRNTTVLNTGLRFLRQLTLGQGVYPCLVEGYDDKGNEVLKPVDDLAVKRFVASRGVRRYMEKVLRDYLKFGCGMVQFVPNESGKIVGLNPLNARHVRFTVPDDNGYQHAIVSGGWDYAPSGKTWKLPLLNEYDPETQADLLQFMGQNKSGFVYAVRDSWSNDDIYSEPIWWPVWVSGWVDIAHLVPQFLKKAYKNQVTWKWHIQIPYSYWDRKFPIQDYIGDVKRRQADINAFMDQVEANLCGAENAEKPLFTNYAVNESNGRVEEEWKIQALDNKMAAGSENLVTSAAANSEILFSLMVNPNVLGAGMPGGAYAGNQGGSNIREAFLVNVANAWIDRQNILDPLELFIKLNGMPECELRFRNTVLTTLDSGAGTQKVVS